MSDPAPEVVLDFESLSFTEMSVIPPESSNASAPLICVLLRQGSPSRLRKINSPAVAVNEKTSTSVEGAGPASEPLKYLFAAELACAGVLFGSLSDVADVV